MSISLQRIRRGAEDVPRTLERLQDNIQASFSRLFSLVPLLGGTLVSATLKVGGSTAVVHKLGKVAQGWIVVDQDVACSFARVSEGNALPDSQILLTHDATTPVTASFWVF